ncbi:MAG: winged helix-turn-helix domain-containing protein [Oligoflexales bacterium]
MRGLWLIDVESKWVPALIGNVAVRAFGSFESFRNLVKFDTPQVANLAVIATAGLDRHVDQIEEWFQHFLPSVPRLYLGVATHDSLDCLSDQTPRADVVEHIRERLEHASGSCMIYKDLWYEKTHQRFRVMGQEDITLSPKEAHLIQLFMQTPSRCVSREIIREKVWDGRVVSPRTIDSHISRVRRHLDGSEVVIDSIYGDGYVMR